MVKFLQSNANHCRAAMDLLAQYELEHRIGVSIVSEPYRIPEDNTWIGSLQESVAIHWNYHCMESTGVPIRRGRYSVAIKWRVQCHRMLHFSKCR